MPRFSVKCLLRYALCVMVVVSIFFISNNFIRMWSQIVRSKYVSSFLADEYGLTLGTKLEVSIAVYDLALSTKVEVVNCLKLFQGDPIERNKAMLYQDVNPKKMVPDVWYINATKVCQKFISSRHYVMTTLTEEEADFPLAFSILIYKDVEQFERLLRTIYRPQNVYCVHVDLNSNSSIQEAAQAIGDCFENVFLIQNRTRVTWGEYSVLEPDIKCMEELLKNKKKWKYFINLTGQEFPLKTNYELVQILKAFNGSNNIGKEAQIKGNETVIGVSDRVAGRLPPPIDVILVKGAVHIVTCRGFVEYAIHNESAKKFLEWNKKIRHPDEMFFNTLNHNPRLKVPGSYIGELITESVRYPLLSRHKLWQHGYYGDNRPCYGKYIHWICILGVINLPLLAETPELFVNKFHLDYQPLTLDCMEELINNRTRDEIIEKKTFNTTYYSQLSFVKNHI